MSQGAPDAVSAVILTQGDRPDDLARAVRSVRALAHGAPHVDRSVTPVVEVVIVWNGVPPVADSPADLDVALDENVGIPAGRNRGARSSRHGVILFLDDDAYFDPGQRLADLVEPFDDPRTAVAAYRISDARGRTARRHVPRLGGRGAARGGDVTSFLGGAVAVRREVFEQLSGYPDDFFYAMEETDLALRIIDAGHRIVYTPDVIVRHPLTEPSRHAGSLVRTARNRVWLAHRDLPWPIAVAYVGTWLMISLSRNLGSFAGLRGVLAGTRDGLRHPLGPRRPISWSTAWRLTRLGRPPIV